MSRQSTTGKGSKKAQGIHNPLCKRLYTLKEAAQYLGRSEWSMRTLTWSQTIPVVKPSKARKIYFDIGDLNDFIERNKKYYT